MKNTLSLKKHLLCDLLVHIMRELLKFVNCIWALNLRMNSGSSLKYNKNWCQAENFPRPKSESLEISVNRTNYKNTQRERTTQQGAKWIKDNEGKKELTLAID